MIGYRKILHSAWPLIVANAAVPLLGLVDTAVIGNVGTVADLGAIALGALIFNFLYWGLGFLRMGTSGFVAQASGAGDEDGVRAALGRSLLLAIVLGVALVGLQQPIAWLAFSLLSGSGEIESLAQDYFSIRIWGAPATLSIFAFMGMLIGRGESRNVLRVQLLLNGLNIVLDILFAGYFAMGAKGIALGTVIAEWVALIYAGAVVVVRLRKDCADVTGLWSLQRILDRRALCGMLTANVDILIRTLMLVFSFAFFIDQSARFGNTILAANHILLQLIAFSAFFLDGYAFVVESLAGRALGAGNRTMFEVAVRKTTILALLTAGLLALGIYSFGTGLVGLLTDLVTVQEKANEMLWLASVYILCSFMAFQLDGVFIGVSFTREMRNAASVSLLIFIAACWFLIERAGMAGLWWAMIVYVLARAVTLLFFYPKLLGSFPLPDSARSSP